MPAEAGAFEAFYASPLQHPVLLWLTAGLATALCLARRGLRPSARRYCAALGALSLADAWLTSSEVYGVGRLTGPLATIVPLLFVLAGDFRFLLFALAADARGGIRPRARSLSQAAALTLVVPLFTQLALRLLPAVADGARLMFLVYELAFAALALALLAWHRNAQTPWVRAVGVCVVAYYGLWAAADAAILFAGADLGYGLRVVPNLLYYGGLIAAIGGFAPHTGVRSRGESSPP
jgi:hypothetical protein